jgi:hypothetical protein
MPRYAISQRAPARVKHARTSQRIEPMSYPAYEPAPSTPAGSADLGRAVTCSTCGCRLQRADDLEGYLHFAPRAGRDAAGCVVDCADKLHDSRGNSL